MEELVLEKDAYEIDVNTWKVSVPEDELRKAGYVKLADDEQVVKKVELIENWAKFMEENKHLPFSYKKDGKCFTDEAINAFREMAIGFREKQELLGLLSLAYFNGYTVKKEPRYYIKFPFNYNYKYLNVFKHSGKWGVESEYQDFSAQTQFTQKEIDELQKDDRAKGLDLNALKVKVPDGELAD